MSEIFFVKLNKLKSSMVTFIADFKHATWGFINHLILLINAISARNTLLCRLNDS